MADPVSQPASRSATAALFGERLAVVETKIDAHEINDTTRHGALVEMIAGIETRVATGNKTNLVINLAQLALVALALVAVAVLAGKSLTVDATANGLHVVGDGTTPATVSDVPLTSAP